MALSVSEHDDRVGGQVRYGNRTWRGGDPGGRGTGKHVSFKQSHSGGAAGGGVRGRLGPKNNRHQGGVNLRNIVSYDDLDSPASGSSSGYQAGRARPRGRGNFKPRGGRGRGGGVGGAMRHAIGSDAGNMSWHKVTIQQGSRYDQMQVLQTLASATSHPVKPINYTKEGANLVFYVDNAPAADAIKAMNEKVQLSDGFPVQLAVKPTPPPKTIMTDAAKTLIKTALSARYTPATKALDLRAFHLDANFQGQPVFLPLYRREVLSEVVKVVGENIPELEAIDLSENRLSRLEPFEQFVSRAPNVKILYLEQNSVKLQRPNVTLNFKCSLCVFLSQIFHGSELEQIRGWKLVDLKLKDNPLIANMKNNHGLEYKRYEGG